MNLHYSLYSPNQTDTVLLLHGMGSAGDDWLLQLPALEPHYRVLAPDSRGHGKSPKPAGPYSIALMAEDVTALLDELHIETAHVVGLSMGGAIAQQLAINQPKRVRSLTLVNTFARVRPAGLDGFQRFFKRIWALQFGTMRDLGEPVITNLFPKPEHAEVRRIGIERFLENNTSKQVYMSVLRCVVSFDARRQLSRITAPTLVVAGDRDRTVPMICKQELARSIPNAHLVVIPDSGHATPIDQHERFNEVLLDFLRQN
jgi:pimeloyl-ACP methyl ester carboxylesterase